MFTGLLLLFQTKLGLHPLLLSRRFSGNLMMTQREEENRPVLSVRTDDDDAHDAAAGASSQRLSLSFLSIVVCSFLTRFSRTSYTNECRHWMDESTDYLVSSLELHPVVSSQPFTSSFCWFSLESTMQLLHFPTSSLFLPSSSLSFESLNLALTSDTKCVVQLSSSFSTLPFP